MTVKKQPTANTGAAGLQTELSHQSDLKIQLSELLYWLQSTGSYQGYWNQGKVKKKLYYYGTILQAMDKRRERLKHSLSSLMLTFPPTKLFPAIPIRCTPSVQLLSCCGNRYKIPTEIVEVCANNNGCKGRHSQPGVILTIRTTLHDALSSGHKCQWDVYSCIVPQL